MDDGIKLSAQTSFMEKGTMQRKEKQIKRNYNQLWVAQTFPKKIVMSKRLKNNDAVIHSLSEKNLATGTYDLL